MVRLICGFFWKQDAVGHGNKSHLFLVAIVITPIGLTAIGLGSVILCPMFRQFGFNHLHFNDVLNPFGISTQQFSAQFSALVENSE